MNSVDPSVYRARREEIDLAFALVNEYYKEAAVISRENREEFEQQYFGEGGGIWLAFVDGLVAGCVALRRLEAQASSGEIKRMYVRSPLRAKGIATSLLAALEEFAREHNYDWLFLDTTDSMERAAGFYRRNGYTPCERYNDNPQATVFMKKRIIRR